MSEILIEEENTIYELDEDCLRQKKKRVPKAGPKKKLRVQGEGNNPSLCLVLILLCCRQRKRK